MLRRRMLRLETATNQRRPPRTPMSLYGNRVLPETLDSLNTSVPATTSTDAPTGPAYPTNLSATTAYPSP